MSVNVCSTQCHTSPDSRPPSVALPLPIPMATLLRKERGKLLHGVTNTRSWGREPVSHLLHRTTTAGRKSAGRLKISGPSLCWNLPPGLDRPR